MPSNAWKALLILGSMVSCAQISTELDPALLAGMRARSIGPAGMSGRIAALEAVESDPSIVYAGAATGGVWKSTNGGLTWSPIFEDQKVAAIGAVAIFQNIPDIVWVGTGEGNTRNSASVGNGVYRSRDGGKTWNHLGLDATERIHRILLHPTDPDVAYVAALGQEWGENEDRGVFKTIDGGKTWDKVLFVDARTGCGDLAMDPSNPEKLFATMWQFRRWPYFFRSGGPGSGLHVTHDGGKSWKKLQEEDGLPKGELGRIGIAFCRHHPEFVYALVEARKSALIRSQDGGETWQVVNEEANVVPRPFYFADVRVDPKWPQRIYSLDYGVRVSEDGGKSFQSLAGAQMLHGDYHAMWIDPNDPDHIYSGDDGGVGESRDRGRSFRFSGTLPVAQFYHIAVDMDLPYHVLGGMQDNSSWRGPSDVWESGGIRSHHWKLVGTGDGYDTQADPRNSSIVYSMWQGGNLSRVDVETGSSLDIKPTAPVDTVLRFNWNSGFALDPFDPDTIYYGSQFVHRSKDRGASWTIVSPDLTSNNPEWLRQAESGGLTSDVTAAENHCTILAIAPSPVENGVIWVSSDDGRLSVTKDGGEGWTFVEGNLPDVPPNTWIPHVEPSKFKGGGCFVVLDDHRRSNWTPYVFRTEDYGSTWKSLSTKDLWGYALVIEQDPADEDLLFLGTEFGLWVSLDGGATWLKWKHGVPTVSVMDLVVHPRDHDLVLGTHGRAAFIIDDVRPLRELDAAALKKPLQVFEPAPSYQHSQRPEPSGFGLGAGEFRGEARPYGALVTYSLGFEDLPHPDDKIERERKEKDRQTKLREQEQWGPLEPPQEKEQEKDPEEDKKKDKPPQVDVTVLDMKGEEIRHFTAPALRGFNRLVWPFDRDDFKRPPRSRRRPVEEEEDEHPGFAQVPPGEYLLKISFRDQEAGTRVSVLPDPRSQNRPEHWQSMYDHVIAAARLREAAAIAIEDLSRARTDLDAVIARVGELEAKAQEGKKGAARDSGRKEEKPKDPLVEACEKAKKEIDELEKRLWVPPDTKGIIFDDDRVLSRIRTVEGYFAGPFEPPTPNNLEHYLQASECLAEFLADLNRFFSEDLKSLHDQAGQRGLDLVRIPDPVAVKGEK